MTLSTAAVATGAGIWGLAGTMSPSADVSFETSLPVDLETIAPGTTRSFVVGRYVIHVRHRTAEQIALAEEDPPRFNDYLARNPALPAYCDESDRNRRATPDGRFIIVRAHCTYYGCVLRPGEGNFDGWFCPCCAAHYDLSGRVRLGPGSRNLAIPRFAVVSPAVVDLNPPSLPALDEQLLDSLLYPRPSAQPVCR